MTVTEMDLDRTRRSNPHSTAAEMNQRMKRVLAMLPVDEATITSLDIQRTLELSDPQVETLVRNMLDLKLMHVVGKIGKRRKFSRGEGTQLTLQKLPSVPVSRVIRNLSLGDTLQIEGMRRRLDDQVEFQLSTPSGVVTLVSVSPPETLAS